MERGTSVRTGFIIAVKAAHALCDLGGSTNDGTSNAVDRRQCPSARWKWQRKNNYRLPKGLLLIVLPLHSFIRPGVTFGLT
jgi:hypothetical protein